MVKRLLGGPYEGERLLGCDNSNIERFFGLTLRRTPLQFVGGVGELVGEGRVTPGAECAS